MWVGFCYTYCPNGTGRQIGLLDPVTDGLACRLKLPRELIRTVEDPDQGDQRAQGRRSAGGIRADMETVFSAL